MFMIDSGGARGGEHCADVIVCLLRCLDTDNRRELRKQVSRHGVSCLQTAGLIIATNYKASITVTAVFEEAENGMLGAPLKSMGIHSADLTCQVEFILMDEDREKMKCCASFSYL